MKKSVLLLMVLILSTVSYAQQYVMTSDGYLINGKIKKGEGYVTLRTYLRDGNELLDSVVMDKKGGFVFRGHTEEAVAALLTVNGMKQYRIYLEPSMNMELTITTKKKKEIEFKNAPLTDKWYSVVNPEGKEDYQVYLSRLENWAVNNPEHIFSPDIMATYLSHYWDYDMLQKHLNVLKGQAVNTYHYRHLREREEGLEKIASGKNTPNIAMRDVKGNNVSLNAFLRGKKYVLINFWATWSEKSKEIVPNLKALYSEYNTKGFDIYGVSLDKNENDFRWFAKQENIPWTNVTDLQMWESKTVKDYMVKSIPDNVLVDAKGKIVARNLSVDQLKEKLAELLDYEGYMITGNIRGITEGTVKLDLLLEGGKRETYTSRINNGNFSFEGTVDKVCMAMLDFPVKDGQISFFMANDRISVTGDKRQFEKVSIKGSPSQDEFAGIASSCNKKSNPMQCLMDYVNANPTSVYSPFIVSNYLYPYLSDEDRKHVVNSLDGKAKQMFQYTLLTDQLQQEENKKDLLSDKAKDFTLSDLNGREVNLYQNIMFNDYTLIVFWASWDNISRNRNMDYLRLYNSYAKKNKFDIISVSLDDSKLQWESAVKQDGINKWTNVSDLKRWSSDVVRLYNLQSIPANMLLDKQGNILGRNLSVDGILQFIINK
ncbi:MAG: redoxin domain-containing protein [Bacteroidales bacterium]|nr:redoxin domain-containing protein [Bacteroidales bacterium]